MLFASEELPETGPPAGEAGRISNPQANNLTERIIIDAEGKKYIYRFNRWLGIKLSALIAFFASMFGIGGGVIQVPMLTKVLNFPVHIATATAHYKLCMCVASALVFYSYRGYIRYEIAVPIGIGTVAGARLGAYISKQYPASKIFRLLAIALFILAFRLLFVRAG